MAMGARTFLMNNGLSLVLLGLFLITLMGQSLAGWSSYNAEQITHQRSAVDYLVYVSSDHFLEAVFENWESEFLQMAAFVILTVSPCSSWEFSYAKKIRRSQNQSPCRIQKTDFVARPLIAWNGL